jgi:hypothetical protein
MDKVEGYFLRRVRKGYVPSVADLVAYVKKYKIVISGDNAKRLRVMRRKFKYMALMQPARKPPAYFSGAWPKIGVVYVDMAEYRKDLRKDNEGCAGTDCFEFDDGEKRTFFYLSSSISGSGRLFIPEDGLGEVQGQDGELLGRGAEEHARDPVR